MSSSGVARKIVVVGGGNAAGYFARAVCAAGRENAQVVARKKN